MSQPVQSIPEVKSTEKETARWPIVLLFVILGISVVAVAIVLGIINGRKNATVLPSAEIPLISPTETTISPTVDLTTDWETYTNTNCGYSLKYPKEWLAVSVGQGKQLTTDSGGIALFPNNKQDEPPSFGLECDAEAISNKMTYSQWIGTEMDKHRALYKPTKESTTSISGVSAIVMEREIINPVTPPYLKVFLFASLDGEGFFAFTIISETKQESLIFDQVISSFRFTTKQ